MNDNGSQRAEDLHTYHPGEEEVFLERIIFSFRGPLLFVFLLATVFFAYQTAGLRPDASFEKMIPMEHPYIRSFMKHISDLGAAGTSIQVAVEHTSGDIFDPDYLDVLQKVNDEVFYLEGVDRNRMRSLWTPNVRWTEVTEKGFEGDKVIDSDYDGSEQAMAQLRQNILRSGEVGRLVSDNYRSSIVQAPLIDIDPTTGEPLDYWALSQSLEEVRDKYEQLSVDANGQPTIRIHIIGFAKIIGDLLDGITAILLFAVITLLITSVLLFLYTRSLRGTLSPLLCSIIAVIWQLGLLKTLGYGLNAYSILIPFLVFAIGVSHGVQIVNAFLGESIAGNDRRISAQRAFRSLYVPGMTALFSDAVGFVTMVLIPIQVIKDLGVAASIGVAVVMLTNLVLLPVMMSYIGITLKTLEHHRQARTNDAVRRTAWRLLSNLASAGVAKVSIAIAALGFAIGIYGGQNLQIGDLDPGAPELQPDSRYNLDNQYITDNYATSSDIFVVMVETPEEQCAQYDKLALVDRFVWHMRNVPGVSSAIAASDVSKLYAAGYNEGNLKWATINRDQRLLGSTFDQMPAALMNTSCSLLPVALFLSDHKAETLQRVVDAAQDFAERNRQDGIHFALAAGNAGIEAATNQEIAVAQTRMMLLIYGVVGALVFLSFASWRAVICIMTPLALTSFLAQALMAHLEIGVKVATLPVIALGVGVGVDYGIYIYSKLSYYLRRGMGIQQAYYHTLTTTGEAVSLTGVMLAVGVATWIWSPIKFQADMGLLLTFMFLWNMVGALWLLPALAHFLVKPEKFAAAQVEPVPGEAPAP
ncbi:MAG: RND family transporter [Halioglobus sp.]|nr:RND family transporter [Halioglobus sp.]